MNIANYEIFLSIRYLFTINQFGIYASPLTLYKDSRIATSDWNVGSCAGNDHPTGIVPGIIDIGCAYHESTEHPPKLGEVTTVLIVLHCADVHPRNFLSHFRVVVPPSDGQDGKARSIATQQNHALSISDILSLGSLQNLRTNFKNRRKVKEMKKDWEEGGISL